MRIIEPTIKMIYFSSTDPNASTARHADTDFILIENVFIESRCGQIVLGKY